MQIEHLRTCYCWDHPPPLGALTPIDSWLWRRFPWLRNRYPVQRLPGVPRQDHVPSKVGPQQVSPALDAQLCPEDPFEHWMVSVGFRCWGIPIPCKQPYRLLNDGFKETKHFKCTQPHIGFALRTFATLNKQKFMVHGMRKQLDCT